jgi:hypothetical protein
MRRPKKDMTSYGYLSNKLSKTDEKKAPNLFLFFIVPFILINAAIAYFMTLSPSFELIVTPSEQMKDVGVTLTVDGIIAPKQVVAYLEDEVIELTQIDSSTYTTTITSNGLLEVDIVNFNGMEAKQYENITSIDTTPPIITEISEHSGAVVISISDDQSGPDLESTYAIDEDGNVIKPYLIEDLGDSYSEYAGNISNSTATLASTEQVSIDTDDDTTDSSEDSDTSSSDDTEEATEEISYPNKVKFITLSTTLEVHAFDIVGNEVIATFDDVQRFVPGETNIAQQQALANESANLSNAASTSRTTTGSSSSSSSSSSGSSNSNSSGGSSNSGSSSSSSSSSNSSSSSSGGSSSSTTGRSGNTSGKNTSEITTTSAQSSSESSSSQNTSQSSSTSQNSSTSQSSSSSSQNSSSQSSNSQSSPQSPANPQSGSPISTSSAQNTNSQGPTAGTSANLSPTSSTTSVGPTTSPTTSGSDILRVEPVPGQ